MLLLVTNEDDLTADWLILELERRRVPFHRFNTAEYPRAATLRWRLTDAQLCLPGATLDASEITGVWWRRPSPPTMPADLSDEEAVWASGESVAALEGFFHAVQARWVSRPAAIAAADSKMEQLIRAKRTGFDVPDSLVTNDRVAARQFIINNDGAICKSLESARVPTPNGTALFYTSIVGLGDLDDGQPFGPEPYLLQRQVPKSYELRVTVIGDHAYACRIDSQAHVDARVDWRLGDVERMAHAVERLPEEVEQRCVSLTHSYGLRFSGIDLARRPDGAYVFFELNASGQWAWIEKLCGLPLAARLADELLASE
ncbi:MAG: RimK domain protein ATP-grasp [Conexibacter sp.]|nr:RimK domain protein ATP-grasp [Conexibacter sp.]